MKHSIRQNIFAIQYLFSFSHIFVVLSASTALFAAIPPVLTKLLIKWVLDDLEKGNFSVFSTLFCISCFILGYEILNALLTHLFIPLFRQKVYNLILENLLQKASMIDLCCFDNPRIYQNIAWTKNAINLGVFKALDIFCMFITNITKLVFISVLFVNVSTIYMLFALVAFFIIYFFNVISSDLSVKKTRETAESDRVANYCHKVFSSVEYAKEIRLFSIGNVITERFRQVCEIKSATAKKYLRKIGLLSFLQVTIPGYFVSEFCLAVVLGYQIIVQGTGSIGDFTMIYSGINSILASLFAIIGPVMQGLSNASVGIEQIREFININVSIKDGNSRPVGMEHKLDIENLCFSYTDGGRQVFENLCMSIPPRAKVAIVGANGSGKSTLVKLLMRLYDANTGSIKLDETIICNYSVSEYRSIFSCVFQDFQAYALSIGSNIAMSSDWEEAQMASAIACAGLRVTDGVTAQSQMLKLFDADGVILSGGQLQKMVLARLLYRTGDILIMDEPSASLDPISEYVFNKRVTETFFGKTIILITHRLSATKDADIIFFLKDGRVIESGTHSALINLGGEYAAMWTAQAQRFRSQSNQEAL